MKCYKVVTKDYKSTIVQDKEYLNTNSYIK